MTHGLTPRQEEARGVVTNGEGNRTTTHLNLTVTMADIDRRPKAGLPMVKMTGRKLPILPPRYAGYDPTERGW